MFYEPLAKLTRAHFKSHLPAYWSLVNGYHDRQYNLVMPKRFDISSVVGGVVGVSRETLPALAIIAFERQFSSLDDDQWTYLYPGQLAGMVSATGPDGADEVEALARRWAGTFEMFLNEHRRAPLAADYDSTGDGFRIKGFGYTRTEFFGAANVDEDEVRVWIDGFRIDFAWETIEAGPGQHG